MGGLLWTILVILLVVALVVVCSGSCNRRTWKWEQPLQRR
jgi:hypothetical protein